MEGRLNADASNLHFFTDFTFTTVTNSPSTITKKFLEFSSKEWPDLPGKKQEQFNIVLRQPVTISASLFQSDKID